MQGIAHRPVPESAPWPANLTLFPYWHATGRNDDRATLLSQPETGLHRRTWICRTCVTTSVPASLHLLCRSSPSFRWRLGSGQTAHAIIGVTPPEPFGAEVGRKFDVAIPIGTEPPVKGRENSLVARLRP
jgi:hypothetical protein